MNTDVVIGIVLIIIATTQTLLSLYYRRTISLLKQENEAAVRKAFGGGWDACVNMTRSNMPETKTTRVSRYLH